MPSYKINRRLRHAQFEKLISARLPQRTSQWQWWFRLYLMGVITCVLLTGLVIYRRNFIYLPPLNPANQPTQEVADLTPIKVTVPSVGINVPITAAAIKYGQWQLAPDQANHLITSAQPTQSNNIVIYAHNSEALFGSLDQAKIDEVVTVQTKSGQYFSYMIKEKQVVNPKEVAAIIPTDKEVLTLYTCTGWLDSKRLIIRAYPLDQVAHTTGY